MKKRHILKDNLSADSEPLLKLHNKMPPINEIHFSYTNSSGIVRKFLKMLPSFILASWKEHRPFAVIETKNVGWFLPAVKSADGLTTELHQKLLFDVTVTKTRGCTQIFPDPGLLLSSSF